MKKWLTGYSSDFSIDFALMDNLKVYHVDMNIDQQLK